MRISSPPARGSLAPAQEAAGELGHGYVGTEHLLLGLMREEDGLAHAVLMSRPHRAFEEITCSQRGLFPAAIPPRA